MDKKLERKMFSANACVKYGFWVMLLLFVTILVLSIFGQQLAGMIVGAVFVVSVFFVFVSSIKAIVPEKSMAYIALGVAIIFILYLLLSAIASISSVITAG